MQEPTDAHARACAAYEAADELRSIALEGLAYAGNAYDHRRYDRVLKCSARLLAAAEGQTPEAVLERISGDLYQVTPLVGVDAMVVEQGKVLLIQRADNRLWCMPGGAVEVGETPAQGAERELREEAGIEGKVERLVALFDSRLWRSGVKRHMIHLVFLVKRISGTPASSAEALDAGYFAAPDLPVLSYGHRDWLPMLLARLQRGDTTAYSDA